MIKVEDFLTANDLRKSLKYSKSAQELGIGGALYSDPLSGKIVTARNGPELIRLMEGYTDDDGVAHEGEAPLINDHDLLNIYRANKENKDPSKVLIYNEGRASKVQEEFTKFCFYMNHVPVEKRLEYRKIIVDAIANPGFVYTKPVGKKSDGSRTYAQNIYKGKVGLVALPVHDQAGALSHFQVYMHSRCITDKNYTIAESINPKTGLPEFSAIPATETIKFQDEEGNYITKQVVDKRRRITAKNLANKSDFMDTLCDYINEKLEEAGLPLLKNYESKKRFAFKVNGLDYGEELKDYFNEFGLKDFDEDTEKTNKSLSTPVDDSFDEKLRTVMTDKEVAETSLSDDIKLIQRLRQKEEEEIKALQEQLRSKIEIHSQLKSAELTKVELASTVIELRKEKASNEVLSRQNDELSTSILAVNNTNENLKDEIRLQHDDILSLAEENIELKDENEILNIEKQGVIKEFNNYKKEQNKNTNNIRRAIKSLYKDFVSKDEEKDRVYENNITSLKQEHKNEILNIDIENERQIKQLEKAANENLRLALEAQQKSLVERFKLHLQDTVKKVTDKLTNEFDAKISEKDTVILKLKDTVKVKDKQLNKRKEISKSYHDVIRSVRNELQDEKEQKNNISSQLKAVQEENNKARLIVGASEDEKLTDKVKDIVDDNKSTRKALGIDDDVKVSDGVKELIKEFSDLYETIYEKYSISADEIADPEHNLDSLVESKKLNKNKKPKPE